MEGNKREWATIRETVARSVGPSANGHHDYGRKEQSYETVPKFVLLPSISGFVLSTILESEFD